MMPDDCIFCKIIKGEFPANIVCKSKYALAFRDINPQAPVHVLIIPKVHITSSRDLNKENIHYLSKMAFLAQEVADEEKITQDGYRWVINTGNNGGQTVNHIHLHLIGGRNMNWPPG
jgi:histidine triad (HIT) family protein